ncbi:MAG: hypothetical protein J0H31_07455, partial [Alphaproteobacteria bacterium]|nr:hypothetical protein [Alphaproteobacteria bacterium]
MNTGFGLRSRESAGIGRRRAESDCRTALHRLHSAQSPSTLTLQFPGKARVARQFIYHMSGLSKAYGTKKVLDNVHL